MSDGSRRPLRVLHIIVGLGAGGAEALLYRLATRPSDIHHEVISLSPPDWYSPAFEQQGVKVHYLGLSSTFSAALAIPRLRRLIRQAAPDVVQTWMYAANLVGGLCARACGVPVVWGIHGSSLDPLRRLTRMQVYAGGLLARWIPQFVVSCADSSVRLHARFGYGAAPGGVIYNGYDPDMFYPDGAARAAARERLGIEPEAFAIGCIARWDPQKDIPNLLEAVKIARGRGAAGPLLLVGNMLDSENRALTRLIGQAGLDDVRCLGRRPDIRELANAFDLHVLASCGAEAFPNTVAETMLCEVPNAVTDIGDSGLIVGETGWVVPSRDPQRLGDAIAGAHLEWQEQPAKWLERRRSARRRIADNFTFDRMANAYEDLWRRIGGKGDPVTTSPGQRGCSRQPGSPRRSG